MEWFGNNWELENVKYILSFAMAGPILFYRSHVTVNIQGEYHLWVGYDTDLQQ